MDDRRLDDILQRLERVETYLEEHSAWHQEDDEQRRGGRRCRCHEHRHEHRHGHWRDDGRHDRGDSGQREGFDEKRVVDLIVRLVAEKVEELLARYEQRRAAQAAPASAPEPPSDVPREG